MNGFLKKWIAWLKEEVMESSRFEEPETDDLFIPETYVNGQYDLILCSINQAAHDVARNISAVRPYHLTPCELMYGWQNRRLDQKGVLLVLFHLLEDGVELTPVEEAILYSHPTEPDWFIDRVSDLPSTRGTEIDEVYGWELWFLIDLEYLLDHHADADLAVLDRVWDRLFYDRSFMQWSQIATWDILNYWHEEPIYYMLRIRNDLRAYIKNRDRLNSKGIEID